MPCPLKNNNMKVLVINCGSSSLKYKLYCYNSVELIAKGQVEKIGEEGSNVRNHNQAVKEVIKDILEKGAVKDLNEIAAIGHRVVHGGESFTQPHLIDGKVIRKIKECIEFAPLHNPANLAGILGCIKFFPETPQAAVFDTAFHQTLPEAAYTYAIPPIYYWQDGIRKYGFHGTSHNFIAHQAAKELKKPLSRLKLITCHLGNGCSITAIDQGKSIDTSMGFTPLEGLMMGTRCGDIDVAAVFHIMRAEKLSVDEMDTILNKKSGLLGISGLSNDFRVIKRAMAKDNRRAKLAYDIFVYRIKKYIGAYYFILGGADAICFSGGIGENSPEIVDDVRKSIAACAASKTKFLVIPTDEELMIANLTRKVIEETPRKLKKK